MTARGTSNTNDRGSAESRRRRKRWLFEIWAADVVRLEFAYVGNRGTFTQDAQVGTDWSLFDGYVGEQALVRCFRCGCPLTWDEVEVDRIKPGCEGGRYTRGNIRPICERDNKILGEQAKRAKAAKRERRNAQARARRAAAKEASS